MVTCPPDISIRGSLKGMVSWTDPSALFLMEISPEVPFWTSSLKEILSSGVVLFVVSAPGAIVTTLLASTAGHAQAIPPPPEAGMQGMIGYLASNVVPPLARVMAGNYILFLLAGLALMILALVGSVAWGFVRERKQAPAQAASAVLS